jgi:hypothetical protein
VQCVNLTDDELWRCIAANTDAMSELLDQRVELEAEIGSTNDLAKLSELMDSYISSVNRFEGEYRAYTAELRRRHAA